MRKSVFFPVGHAERHVRIEKTRGAPERGVDVAPLVEEPGVVDAQRQADFDVIHFLALRVDFAVDVGRHLYRILVGGAVIAVAGIEGQLQRVARGGQLRQRPPVVGSPLFQVVQIEE